MDFRIHPHSWKYLVPVLLWVMWGMGVGAQNYHFNNYNVREGIGQSQVYCVVEDSRGFLWMGTAGGGVSVFDGSTFRHLTVDDGLKSNEVTSILEDGAGRMWLGHDEGGLTLYDGWRTQIYRHGAGYKMEGRTNLFHDGQGGFWVTTEGAGLYHYQNGDFQHFGVKDGILSDTLRDMEVAGPQKAYLGSDAGLVVWDGRVFQPLIQGVAISALEVNRKGMLWYGHEGKVYQLRGDSGVVVAEIKGVGDIADIYEDKQGRIWVSGNLGMGMYTSKGFKRFTGEDGLWETGVYSVSEDSWGNLWIGTEGGGVSRYSEEAWVMYGKGTLLDQRAAFAVAELNPELFWVGTERGLFAVTDTGVAPVKQFPIKDAEIYSVLKTKSGDVYVAGNDGLFLYHGGVFSALDPQRVQGDYRAFSLTEGRDGNVWVASSKGALLVKGKSVIALGKHTPVMGKSQTQILVDTQGRRWHVNMSSGIVRLGPEGMQHLNLPQNYSNNRAFSIAEDAHGSVWIGTSNGVLRWQGDASCYVNPGEGLLGSLVYILQPDSAGNLWVGTERGLNKLILGPKSELLDIQTFGPDEGFRGQECNQGSSIVDSQGRLWVGTIFGLCRYDPRLDHVPDRLPKLHFTGLELNLEKVNWNELGFEVEPWSRLPQDLVLTPNQNHLRFSFQANSMWRPEKIRYKYMLEGLDASWSRPTSETHAVYTALPPGDYVFKVKAADANGKWTPERRYSFRIRAPFYQTAWFLFGSILLAFLTLYGLFRLRLRNANKIRERLERKVKERTEELEMANRVKSEFLAKMSHEIRTPMNGVIGMTELLSRTPLDGRQQKFVDNIRVSGQNLLGLINDILDFSRIESGKVELESVPVDLRKLIEEVLDILAYGAYKKGLELLIWIDPEIRGPILADPARLKQIILNLVGNAIKFTEQGQIKVTAKIAQREADKAHFLLSVKDSGIGIPQNKHRSLFESFSQVDASTTRRYGGTGLGLAISYSLARMMGGDMWVESELGQGTEFFFSVQAGLSAPWKLPEGEHPATRIPYKHIAAAVANPEAREIFLQYVKHWGLEAKLYDDLSDLSEALLAGNPMDFVVVDTRLFPAGVPAGHTARHLMQLTGDKGIPCAVLCDPGLEVEVQPTLGTHGWLISKPWKRDDLLAAMVGDRHALAPKALPLEIDHDLGQRLKLDILIAEDNPINVEVATGMLKNYGYGVRVAEDGVEALKEIAQQMPDLVFMDVQMPRMDGLVATREIVRLYGDRRPRIVAMTANAMASDRQQCIDAGMDTFISKPFAAAELRQVLLWAGTVLGRPLVEAAEVSAAGTELEAGSVAEEVKVEPVVPNAEVEGQQLTDLTMLVSSSGGEQGFIVAILGKMIVKLPEAIEELKVAAAEENWDQVRAVAHRTKSSAAYTGAEVLREQLKQLELVAGTRTGLEEVAGRLVDLEALTGQVVKELQAYLIEMDA